MKIKYLSLNLFTEIVEINSLRNHSGSSFALFSSVHPGAAVL